MSIRVSAEATPNNALNADSERRGNVGAPPFTAGYDELWKSARPFWMAALRCQQTVACGRKQTTVIAG